MPQVKPKMQGNGVTALRESLIEISRTNRWPLLEALPVTRFLGKSYGISNVSAFRVLNELSDSGQLWRAANGRYFLPEARRLLEKPAMLACLIRRLEHWTQVGREIMLGVDDVCGELERAMLLVHDRVLFRQTNPTAQALSGSDREIRQTMEDFLLVHSERIRGVILDELWPERVLARFKNRIQQGVVLYRSTNLPFLGCVSADVQSAARMVANHAAQNQFAKLIILLPFRGYPPSEEMLDALQAAIKEPFGEAPVFTLDSSPTLAGLIAGLRKERRKTLLVATEDNAAVAVLDALRQAGIDVPGRVGLVTTMGSRIALERSMTSAGFDFRLMGSEAARMAINGPLQHLKLAATFSPGGTA
jgi:hypothetical protein